MKNQKAFVLWIFTGLVCACLQTAALGQTGDKVANVSGAGSSVRMEVSVQSSGGTLIVSAPDGRVFQREFRGGSPEFPITDPQGQRLPDGVYAYELRLKPEISAETKEALAAGRGKDDEPEADRAARKRVALPGLIQSGSFAIVNGSVIVAGAMEEQKRAAKVMEQPKFQSAPVVAVTKARLHHPPLNAMPDQVIADDLIVQGSACVGLDCVNNESFGFDTIRLKENNTRLKFDDTSTSAGFPANDWQLTANDSASGGANKFSIEDITGSKVPFTVTAGAPTNSMFVDSSGRLGLRTGAPVLDLHISTSNTPAHRLEQTNAGGFTAQTWDIGGNEANFFVRDVTGGSRLPFRIRPGAPTSSIDISASGNVGVGTASPTIAGGGLEVSRNGQAGVRVTDTAVNGKTVEIGVDTVGGYVQTVTTGADLRFFTGNAAVVPLYLTSTGNVGVGTTIPDQKLSVNGDADKIGGGSWLNFSDERLKTINGRYNSGLRAVMQLQPIRYKYNENNALGLKSEGEHIGFGAQTLQKVIPEAVTKNSAGYLLVNNDPIIWTMLNAIKEQQKEIAQLQGQIRQLRAASHRRKR